jgi:tetratricopeptide (TPR) repeat protein
MMSTDDAFGTLAVHRLPLYNPSRLKDAEVIAAFAARKPLLERIIADLGTEESKSRAQHHLIIGQRGMGKTLLLARIAAELRSGPLAERFIPLVFAEEQYAIDRLSKFWLNCLDSLADEQDRAGAQTAVDQIDATVQQLTSRLSGAGRDDLLAREALEAFLKAAATTGRRPVLLVDNLQIVFERLSPEEQHSLRELLMRPGCPVLIGASPSPLPDSQDYGAAFYDHFKVHYLRPLAVEEMKSVMLHLAAAVARDDVRKRVVNHPERLEVLRLLTGGNPRTTVTLFFLYAEDFSPNVFGDLENLLDRVTPLYKAIFEELSPQQQVIASAIANHWDPVTSRMLTESTGLAPQQLSPQLDRLEKTGFIEKVELFNNASTGYQIAERFFNVWFLMRSASRRQRREVEFLTRFLQSFYEAPERDRLARHLMSQRNFNSDSYLFACATADSQSNPLVGEELKRHIQLDVLRQQNKEARRKLEEILDLAALPPATLAFDQLRRQLVALVPKDAEVTPEQFADKILGDRQMFRSGEREQLAARTEKLSPAEIAETLEIIEQSRRIDIEQYSDDAVLWFANRLISGQLRSSHDKEDWDRAFQATEICETIQLMVQTLPKRLGSQLSNKTFKHISKKLTPSDNDEAWSWFNWGFDLHIQLERYEEAEATYRKTIELDPEYAYPWLGLGVLLSEHLQRYEEAEAAYREAIALDPKEAASWTNLGNLLCDQLQRYEEAEAAYREAIKIDPASNEAWNNLGNLLSTYLQRYEEAEAAYREAIALDPKEATSWNGFGNLLCDHLWRYEEAEVAYRKAIALDPKDATSWNGFGNLLCDYLQRFEEAATAYTQALQIDPTNESVRDNIIFLQRDFLGQGVAAQSLLDQLTTLPKLEFPDTLFLHKALFSAYDANWGLVTESLKEALEIIKDGFSPVTTDDWMRASAVLLHLNYGAELLEFLQEQGYHVRLRPWYEALNALQRGDRRYLQNVAPEIRTTAENFYDQIERRLNALPDSTRRRPVPEAKKRTKTRR